MSTNDEISQLQERVQRLLVTDGWKNVLAGLAGKFDKSTQTTIDTFTYLDETTLGNVYMADGIAAKIIDIIPNDMIKKGITISYPEMDENSTENAETLQAEFFKKNTLPKLAEAQKWNRAYGGSILVIQAEGSGRLQNPLNINRVRDIWGFKAIPRTDVNLFSSDFNTDPESKNFGQIELYDIDFKSLTFQKTVKVHESRVIEFLGGLVPDDIGADTQELRYWGKSEIQTIWNALKDYGSVTQSIVNILLEFLINVFKFENLRNMLAEDNGSALMQRMDIINQYKSVLNAVILSENEDFIRNVASVTGLPELYDRYMMNLSAVSDIPVTKLFGRSPAGQNATGQSDEENYYSNVAAQQELIFRQPIQYILEIMAAYLNLPDNFSFKFNPLKPLSEKEEAEVKKLTKETEKIQADTDKIYIETFVRTAEDIAEERFPED